MEKIGIEPLALKLLVGVLLTAVGLGLALTLYQRAGKSIEHVFSFDLSLEPESWELSHPEVENSLSVRVTVQAIGDYDKNVSLSVDQIPAGIKVTFSPPSGKPTFYSTMTLTVSSIVQPGEYVLTVRGKGVDGAEKTAPFTLRVK